MKEIMEAFALMVEKIANSGKVPRQYNTGIDIYRSEIHIIMLIGNYTRLYVTEIARKLGVTKGAVSQILKKLENKGLIDKFTDETNHTRMLVRLTDRGQIAYRSHEEYHQQHDSNMIAFLENLDDYGLDTILTFIDKVSKMTENHL